MKFIMVSCRDMVSGVWNNPFFGVSRGGAIRGFQDEVNRASEDNILYKHCDDFELFQLGSFDSETGVVEVLARPESLILGRDAKVSSVPSLREVK